MFIALFATSYKESWVCRRWLVVGLCHPATAADVHSTQRDLVGKKSVTFIILFSLSLPLRRKAAICVDEINLQYYMQHWIVKRLFLPSLPSHHFIFFFLYYSTAQIPNPLTSNFRDSTMSLHSSSTRISRVRRFHILCFYSQNHNFLPYRHSLLSRSVISSFSRLLQFFISHIRSLFLCEKCNNVIWCEKLIVSCIFTAPSFNFNFCQTLSPRAISFFPSSCLILLQIKPCRRAKLKDETWEWKSFYGRSLLFLLSVM